MSPQWHPASCKVCGARRPWVHVSGTGLCPDHSRQRMETNLRSLHEKRGPAYRKWLKAIAQSIVREARQLDEARDEG